ncbi:MAG: pyridine nucleotide-disulfide oxidoreductase/dicluster-binding protein [Bacillota bacterium]|jgi:glutamate synthase (NADPH/NADH) small chain
MTMNPKDLHDIGLNCLEAHAPFCVAACPVHVDVKGLAEAVKNGDFVQGLEILRHNACWPGIIGYLCEHPCQKKCKRNELEESVQISKLERACVDYAYDSMKKESYSPSKKHKIAIVGSGLSGLTVALTLAKRGFQVTIFEAGSKIGGRLWDIPQEKLPQSVLEKDLSLLTDAGVKILLNITVGTDITLEELTKEFNAVYLGIGQKGKGNIALEKYDPVTLRTSNPAIFVGGSILGEEIENSPVLLVASGQKAALSIERSLQKVSLTANRKNEGAYDTKLYTNVEWYEKKPAVLAGNGTTYTREEAIEEANRCIQCRCVECMRGCTYLKVFDEYPGSCIKSVVKNVNIMSGWGVRYANKFINSCNVCGLCKEMCPVDIDMGFINREARRLMWEMEYLSPALHDFPLRDMEFSNGVESALLKHQPGFEESKYLFFPGCQFSASLPETVKKAYRFLTERLEGGVGLMIQCCGLPADWAGRQELSQEIWDDIVNKWEQMGKPVVISGCPGCYRTFKESMPQIELKIISEVLLELELPNIQLGNNMVFSFHDPCTSRYEKIVQDSTRALARKLGAKIEELPYSRERTQCCGYGGLQYHLNPELTEKVVRARTEKHPNPYLTSCSNCRDFFQKYGKDTTHILELIWGKEQATKGKEYSILDFQERRDNRRHLKTSLLQEFWKEDNSVNERGYKKLKLMISEELRKKMHDQCILEEDLQMVIDFAEKNNQKMLSPETGHFVAGKRYNIITYWVEYTKENDYFVVHNCYSHRMQVLSKSI